MFHSILVGVDGSEHADAALAQAIDLATAEGARLTLLSAWQPLTTWYAVGMVPIVTDELFNSIEAEARHGLEAAQHRVPAAVPTEALLVRGSATQAILDQVARGEHDLAVLGSRGRGTVTAMLLGSVSQSVLHHSPVPTMIVHAQTSKTEGTELEGKELDQVLVSR